ncbi:MAG: ATP synthase F1 subunit gamma [bacterium]|nr:ATP synthase F1 subunit gamma [bacterium]
MPSKRSIQDKIRATGNIRQITRAMELVAATKMRKAEHVALRARPFAKNAFRLLRNLLSYAHGEQAFQESSLFQKNEKGDTCLLLITSDRGLCGSYNTSVLRGAVKFIREEKNVRGVAVGKKAATFFRKAGIQMDAEFSQLSDIASLADGSPIAEFLLSQYEKGIYQRVFSCSTMFLSALSQKAELREILPLSVQSLQDMIQGILPQKGMYAKQEEKEEAVFYPYVMELPFNSLFDALLRQLFYVEVLHLLFESNASEHASRMVAMKNATENATDILDTLTLSLNKARQAAITQELAEVSTAKEALTAE